MHAWSVGGGVWAGIAETPLTRGSGEYIMKMVYIVPYFRHSIRITLQR